MNRLLDVDNEELRRRFRTLEDPRDVAHMLEVDYAKLVYHIYQSHVDRRYWRFAIPKRSGGIRSILAPATALKIIQQKLNQVLQAIYDPRRSAQGFVRGRSVRTNAERHSRQQNVLNIDLIDFFPTINFGRVRGLLMASPYERNARVATVLAQICCHDNQLPQGAPTSPVVANMICAKMDSLLRRLAQKYDCRYTRYADDLSISTRQRSFPAALAREKVTSEGLKLRLGSELLSIIRANGFRINFAKVHLQHRAQRQEVTGLTVNEKPNVQRSYIRQLRSMLHAWEKFGEEDAEAEFLTRYFAKHRNPASEPPKFRNVVKGKLAFLGMVKGRTDPVFLNLLNRARSIDEEFWRHSIVPDAVWVLECQKSGAQGTAFMLEGVGLVTCAHVLTSDMIAMRSHDPNKHYPIEVVSRNDALDLAVVRIDAPRCYALKAGDPKVVKTGSEVVLLGFPRWFYHQTVQIDRGFVTGFRPHNNVRWISISQTIIKGNSGGPVLNGASEVIGVAARSADLEPPDFENGVIPIDALERL